MSDPIGHECGLAMVRLRQPLSYYNDQHGDIAWGLRRTLLLMEKQRNRGQDGAGVAVTKFDMPPGVPYQLRVRSDRENALERIFEATQNDIPDNGDPSLDTQSEIELKQQCGFLGEAYLGHLRYATHHDQGITNCHPRIRKNNIASKNIAVAGNFNMTNSAELFEELIGYGLDLVGDSDTQVVLERLGYSLDREHELLTRGLGPGSFRGLRDRELALAVSNELDLASVLTHASSRWDGGYLFAVMIGNGDMLACRDPHGIRPGYFHIDDEVVAVASERAALVNVFDVSPSQVEPIKPGHLLYVKRNGDVAQKRFAAPGKLRQCTFERIYFSRGNDPDIYEQRKSLGRALVPRVLDAIDRDLNRAVFSYIPNTAETAYFGLLEELQTRARSVSVDRIMDASQHGALSREQIEDALDICIRAEKVAHKDQKLRTFISSDVTRSDLVAHIYDITRDSVGPDESLVVLDDSIVRGTTLRESIITILARLEPKRIVVVSSAPPIMYPDCYGIDMSQLGRFIAFEAAIALLHEDGEGSLLDDIEADCRAQLSKSPETMGNCIAPLYDRVSLERLSGKIAQLITPADLPWDGEIRVIYQDLEGLRAAMPEFTGDWYFTGDYPTPGGFRVLATSFLNWREQREGRAY